MFGGGGFVFYFEFFCFIVIFKTEAKSFFLHISSYFPPKQGLCEMWKKMYLN